jgi:hypothetical protein
MRKIAVISITLLALLVAVFITCKSSSGNDPRGTAYAGSAKCMQCHRAVFDNWQHTAHFLASSPASTNTVLGSFNPGSNVFAFNSTQKIVMQKLDSGLFQRYHINGKLTESHRFDVVLGGIKGQSYLYWKGNGLNQLPVSYYASPGTWFLSPRYVAGYAFERAIGSRCFECHASYIGDQPGNKQRLNETEQFDKTSLIYSIDCERCHGPGAQHVDFQINHPESKTARFITRFSSLSRAQKIDVCTVCHSGNKTEMLRSTFGFKPGDKLANFKLPGFVSMADTASLDVHGNQVQLLKSSKCFISSQMVCSTCHDVHQNQRGAINLFVQKCLTCHSEAKHTWCKVANASNAQLIQSRCIDCHMPALPSKVISASVNGKSLSADILVRTHHIAIYPAEVKKITAAIH